MLTSLTLILVLMQSLLIQVMIIIHNLVAVEPGRESRVKAPTFQRYPLCPHCFHQNPPPKHTVTIITNNNTLIYIVSYSCNFITEKSTALNSPVLALPHFVIGSTISGTNDTDGATCTKLGNIMLIHSSVT